MRVIQFITQSRGGPVDHAVDVAGELARLGHESHIVGPDGDYTSDATETGVQCHRVNMPSKFDVAGAWSVARLVAGLQPDVVHCQDRRAGLVGRIIAGRRGLPCVYTLHGVPDPLAHLVPGNLGFARPSFRVVVANRWGERLLASVPHSVVVTPCRALQDYAHNHVGIPNSRLFTVHNGISPNWGAEALRQVDDHSSPTTVAWMGVMQPVKRVPELVHALADVPDVRLLLVGDGPERTSVETAIQASGIGDRVDITGFRSEPAPLLGRADMLVLPSAAEACPMVILQAMSLGLPVIATRVGGIPEVVRDGVDGLLVDAGDDVGLRDAVALLAKDEELRRTMGSNGQQRVHDDFSIADCTQALLRVYERAQS